MNETNCREITLDTLIKKMSQGPKYDTEIRNGTIVCFVDLEAPPVKFPLITHTPSILSQRAEFEMTETNTTPLSQYIQEICEKYSSMLTSRIGGILVALRSLCRLLSLDIIALFDAGYMTVANMVRNKSNGEIHRTRKERETSCENGMDKSRGQFGYLSGLFATNLELNGMVSAGVESSVGK
jgi:hypothetical protein